MATVCPWLEDIGAASGASSRAVMRVSVCFMLFGYCCSDYFSAFAIASTSLILKRTLTMEQPMSSFR